MVEAVVDGDATRPASPGSRKNRLHHPARDIREPVIAAGVAEGELFVIEAGQVEHGGVQGLRKVGFRHSQTDADLLHCSRIARPPRGFKRCSAQCGTSSGSIRRSLHPPLSAFAPGPRQADVSAARRSHWRQFDFHPATQRCRGPREGRQRHRRIRRVEQPIKRRA